MTSRYPSTLSILRYPAPPVWMTMLSLVYPLFYVVVSMYEYSLKGKGKK